jgi:protein arginine N-methyltransferase 2
MTEKKYIYENIKFEKDKILDKNNNSIMMSWETIIMYTAAKTICVKKGDILNIGFGMGIIDSFIQEESPHTHWIIEAHPQILKKMKEQGWYDKKNVKILEGTWQQYIYSLPLFDGIFFDTWEDNHVSGLLDRISYLLKSDGIFSYSNSPKDGHLNIYPYTDIYCYTTLIKQNLYYEYTMIDVKNEIKQNQTIYSEKNDYFPRSQEFYYLPIWTKNIETSKIFNRIIKKSLI